MKLHNQHGKLTDPLSDYTVTRHTYGPNEYNFGDLYLPDGPGLHPIVPLLHGGFWRAAYDLTLMEGLADSLARQGIAVWNIEYRRVGNRGGGWPGTLQDVALAMDYLRVVATPLNIDLQRIVPIGHSAGGQLALWLAGRSRLPQESLLATPGAPLIPAGVISLAGAIDLKMVWQLHLSNDAAAAFLGGSPDGYPERYAVASPAALLPLGIPQVLIHGTSDANVPLAISQAYAQKAREVRDNVKLIELPNADHFVVIDSSSDARTTTMRELQRLLTR
jgi:acetyl esterase/lipase